MNAIKAAFGRKNVRNAYFHKWAKKAVKPLLSGIIAIVMVISGIPLYPGDQMGQAHAATINASINPSKFNLVYSGKTEIAWNYQDRSHSTTLEICKVKPIKLPPPPKGAEPPTPYSRTTLEPIRTVPDTGQKSYKESWNGYVNNKPLAATNESYTICVVPSGAEKYFSFANVTIDNPAPPKPAHLQVLPNLDSTSHIIRGVAERGTKVRLSIQYTKREKNGNKYDQVRGDTVTYEIDVPFDDNGKNDGSHLTWSKAFDYSKYFTDFPERADNKPAKYVREWQLPIELREYELADITATTERLPSNPFYNTNNPASNKSALTDSSGIFDVRGYSDLRVERFVAPAWDVSWGALAGYYYKATSIAMMDEKIVEMANDNLIPLGICKENVVCPQRMEKGWNLILQDHPVNQQHDLQLSGNILEQFLGDLTPEAIAKRGNFPNPSWWDPINLATGNFDFRHTNMSLQAKMPLDFTATYHSRDDYNGSIGYGWHHSWEWRIEREDQTVVNVVTPVGAKYTYKPTSDGHYRTPDGTYNTLIKQADGTYLMETPQNWKYIFRQDGLLYSITDHNGNQTQLTYQNTVLQKVETVGASMTFDYGPGGKIATVTDQTGRQVKYEYDEDTHDLISMELSDGAVIRFKYDDKHQMTEMTNPEGNATLVNTYDDNGRVIRQKDFNGNTGTVRYLLNERKTITTDPLGQEKTFEYDDRFRQTAIHYPDGTVDRFAYDKNDNMTLHVDRKGNNWGYEYDEKGNLTKTIDPLQHTTVTTYNRFNMPETITDALGNVTTISYDQHGNMIGMTDALGQQTVITRDTDGVLSGIVNEQGEKVELRNDSAGFAEYVTDPAGFKQRSLRDGLHRVKEQIDPLGQITKLEYDQRDRVKSRIDALGNREQFGYDKDSNLISHTDASGSKTTMTYAFNKVHTVTDHLGNQSTYEYDQLGRIKKTVAPNGAVSTYSYNDKTRTETMTEHYTDEHGVKRSYVTEYRFDANGNLEWQKNPNGGITQIQYDERNLPTQVTDPEGAVTVYAHDALGRLTQETDPLGATTAYTYDKLNRLTTVTDALGQETKFEYDKVGRLKQTVKPGGAIWRMGYDARGLLTEIIDPMGSVTTIQLDELGRAVASKDAMGAETKYSYDALGRIISITDPLGNTTKHEYDAVGRLLKRIDAKDHETSYSYDALGQLKKVINALGEETSYSYDALGNLSKKVTGSGAKTQWTYDLLGRLTQETNPNGETEQYRYSTTTAELAEKKDGLGRITTYSFDKRGAVTGIRLPDGNLLNYSYDGRGQLVGADTLHDKKSLSYDALGRVTRIHNKTWNKAVQFAYDAAGNRTAVTDPEKRITTYTYDVLNRLTSMTDPDDFTTKFAYDKIGALTSIERPNGINTTYTYNANHWMTGLENRGDFTHNSFTYEYDKVGNKKSQVEEDGARTTYVYDPLDRVSKVEYPQAKNAEILKIYDLPFKKAYRNWSPYSYRNAMVTPSRTVEYSYDKDGNRLTMSEDGKTTAYKYDPAGRLIQAGKEQFKYDANGNLSEQSGGKQGHVKYSYTGYDKLKSVQYDDRSKVEYEYDAFLQKIARTEFLIDPRQQAGREEALTKQRMYYLNDGLNVMKEYGENLEPIAQYYEANDQIISRRAFQYTGRDNIDEPLNKRSRPQVRGMLRGDMTYYLNDQLGSVTHITDRTSETLEQYRYDAFGSLMTPITPEYNTIGYTGQILDPKTGLMDYNARWYNPNVGRFTTEDTYEGEIANPLSQNLYTYVTNNPIGYTDPSGHEGIVVSGGNYAVDSHGGYKYNFIEPALKKIWELRKGNPNETIAWLVADEGWNDGDWANFSKAVSTLNVNTVRLSSSDDFINYINKKTGGNSRMNDKITSFTLFSHGLKGKIPLGYNYSSSYNANLDLTVANIKNINGKAFDTPLSWFYSCNTATGGRKSFAQAWVNQVGGRTQAYEGKTTYQYMMYPREYFTWNALINRKLGGKWADYAEFVDLARMSYGFSRTGSVRYPEAGNGATLLKFTR